MSAPHMYASCLSELELKPSLSFLNVGSGSGYVSSIAACVLGAYGINHGIELNQSAVNHAKRCFNELRQKLDSERIEYDKAHINNNTGNNNNETNDDTSDEYKQSNNDTTMTESITSTQSTTSSQHSNESTNTNTSTTSSARRADPERQRRRQQQHNNILSEVFGIPPAASWRILNQQPENDENDDTEQTNTTATRQQRNTTLADLNDIEHELQHDTDNEDNQGRRPLIIRVEARRPRNNDIADEPDTDNDIISDDEQNEQQIFQHIGIGPLLQTLFGGVIARTVPIRKSSTSEPKPIFRPPLLCNTIFKCGNAFELNINNECMKYDRIYIGAGTDTIQLPFFAQLLAFNGILVLPNDDKLMKVRRLSNLVLDTDELKQEGESLFNDIATSTTAIEPTIGINGRKRKILCTMSQYGNSNAIVHTESLQQLTTSTRSIKYMYITNNKNYIRQRYLIETISVVGFKNIQEPNNFILNNIEFNEYPIFQPILYDYMSKNYQNAVDAILILQRRNDCLPGTLPLSIWLYILQMCHRQWFVPTDNSVIEQAKQHNQNITNRVIQIVEQGKLYQTNQQTTDQAIKRYELAIDTMQQINNEAELTIQQSQSLKPVLSYCYTAIAQYMYTTDKDKRNNTNTIIEYTSHAIKLDKHNSTALLLRSHAYCDKCNYNNALDDVTVAATIDDNIEAQQWLTELRNIIKQKENDRIHQKRQQQREAARARSTSRRTSINSNDNNSNQTNDTTNTETEQQQQSNNHTTNDNEYITNGVSEIDPEHRHTTMDIDSNDDIQSNTS